MHCCRTDFLIAFKDFWKKKSVKSSLKCTFTWMNFMVCKLYFSKTARTFFQLHLYSTSSNLFTLCPRHYLPYSPWLSLPSLLFNQNFITYLNNWFFSRTLTLDITSPLLSKCFYNLVQLRFVISPLLLSSFLLFFYYFISVPVIHLFSQNVIFPNAFK